MTVNDIIKASVALMGDDYDASDNYTNYISILNLIISETFDLNNAIREYKGLVPFTDIPTVTSLTDVITYDSRVLNILAYAVAGNQLIANGDMTQGSQRLNKFEYMQTNILPITFEDITDYYSGDE